MSISDELDKLGELHRRGDLSDDEFTRAKARVLGEPARNGAAAAGINALRRSRSDRWLGGVCGGLARITGVAAWLWRLAFVLLVACAGTGVLVYVLLWVLVPDDDVFVAAQPGQAQPG
jgi:phage shock protein C